MRWEDEGLRGHARSCTPTLPITSTSTSTTSLLTSSLRPSSHSCRCNFRLIFEDPPGGSSGRAEVSPDTRWTEIERCLGPPQGRSVLESIKAHLEQGASH
eukprot:759409-Hanusia_phi.AAC.2